MNPNAKAPEFLEFDVALSRIEKALADAGRSLVAQPAVPIEPAFQLLQQTLRECGRLDVGAVSQDRQIQQRMRLVGVGLAQLHQAVARSGALVQKRLQTLLPTHGLDTYGRRQVGHYGSGRTAAAATSLTA